MMSFEKWLEEDDPEITNSEEYIKMVKDGLAQGQAINSILDAGDDKLSLLRVISSTLPSRFTSSDTHHHVKSAILARQTAIESTPDAHPDSPSHLSDLGNSIQDEFECLCIPNDIDNALLAHQQGSELTPDGHASAKAAQINDLGMSFQARYEQLGELSDLDSAISILQDAIVLMKDDDAESSMLLNNLGISLRSRFEHLGYLSDIEQSIAVLEHAVQLIPDGHSDKPACLTNLGNSLNSRFIRLRNDPDVNAALKAQRRAVELTPYGHADLSGRLNNLSMAHMSRLLRFGRVFDLEEAISVQRQALALTTDEHPDKTTLLSNLGRYYCARYKRFDSEDVEDLEEAICALDEAVSLTPDGHRDKAISLTSLGIALWSRYEKLKEFPNLSQARQYYLLAAKTQSAAPSTRLFAAKLLFNTLHVDTGNESIKLEVSKTIMELIPKIIWLGQSLHRRLELVAEMGSETSRTAAMVVAAFEVGDVIQALEWLEEGRSIVWSQILRLRVPHYNLRRNHEALAIELEGIAGELESAEVVSDSAELRHSGVDNRLNMRHLEQDARRYRQLANRYETLLKDIRGKEGFENFLLPQKVDQLKGVAENGPVALSACHVPLDDLYCDAAVMSFDLQSCLVVGQSRGQRTSKVTNGNQKIARIINSLESDVVEPIIRKLVDEQELSQDIKGPVTHITWCCTADLSFLPLHAAAIRLQKKLKTAPIVSSYTPSLATLISRQNSDSELIPSLKVLGVSQSSARGHQHIPNTKQEINLIQKAVGLNWLNDETATVSAVSEAMQQHNIVHFACHGKQDTADPTQSAFILSDGDLSLGDLIKLNLPDAQLAVLSACQTATGDKTRPEEAMHLAAGMLSAGFRSVVATMWSIGDQDAPVVAEAFYSKLCEFEQEKGGRSDWRLRSAHALHFAVEKLREEVGEEEFFRWVPFVHYGV